MEKLYRKVLMRGCTIYEKKGSSRLYAEVRIVDVNGHPRNKATTFPMNKGFAAANNLAEEWLNLTYNKLKNPDLPTVRTKTNEGHTLSDLLTEFKYDRIKHPFKRKRGHDDMIQTIHTFINNNHWLGTTSFYKHDVKDWQAWYDAKASDTSPATANRILNDIRSLYNKFGIRERKFGLPTNLLGKDCVIQDRKSEKRSQGKVMTKEQEQLLFKAFDNRQTDELTRRWYVLVLLALTTGMRRGEILKLDWHHILWESETINNEPDNTKDEEPRELPMCKLLVANLKYYYDSLPPEDRQPDRPVFLLDQRVRHLKGKRLTEDAVEKGWDKLCKEAGIPRGKNNRLTLRFHDLRHTAITRLASLKPVELTTRENAYMSGHLNTSMLKRYEHLELISSIRAKLDAAYPTKRSDLELKELRDFARKIFTADSASSRPPEEWSDYTLTMLTTLKAIRDKKR